MDVLPGPFWESYITTAPQFVDNTSTPKVYVFLGDFLNSIFIFWQLICCRDKNNGANKQGREIREEVFELSLTTIIKAVLFLFFLLIKTVLK